MDKTSVAAALAVAPATKVDLAWDAAGRVLTIAPQVHWSAGMFHTITVDAGALAATGAPCRAPRGPPS